MLKKFTYAIINSKSCFGCKLIKNKKESTNMKELIPPCSYQGGKQRLSKEIVDIIFKENIVDDNTQFYDICCGSGAITLELINRGIHPNNITMIDSGGYGAFWQSIANAEFDLHKFKEKIDNLPSVENIQNYLREINSNPINEETYIYDYLLLQCGSFGSKQIQGYNGVWKGNTFRNYWLPTETSNRRSHVNPMMPMPNTLYDRVEQIVVNLSGNIKAFNVDVFQFLYLFDKFKNSNVITYIDPPYMNTSGYENNLDIYELINCIKGVPIYISEGIKMNQAKNSYLISNGRNKGNINGSIRKKPTEEWLNVF